MKLKIQKNNKTTKNWLSKNVTYFILTLCIFAAIQASAQVPILEKTYDVSRKAKNGYLAHIETNDSKGTIDMIYVLSSTTKHKIKYEIYTYDKDLNLIKIQASV